MLGRPLPRVEQVLHDARVRGWLAYRLTAPMAAP
jgi:hypothetical protein